MSTGSGAGRRDLLSAAGLDDATATLLSEDDPTLGERPTVVDTGVGESERVGRFRLGRRLGRGGMGEVYLAEDLALGRRVALKLVPARTTPAATRYLRREARALARLQHPGIATFYESGESEGRFFLAMELVPGETLAARLRRGPLEADEGIALGSRLAEALVHAHHAGILHRDIKPANIMLRPDGEAKLLDYGVAATIRSSLEPAKPVVPLETALDAEAGIIGTPGYMAPEQLRGEPLDGRSDLFALCVVLFEAITGRRAFPGANAAECMTRTIEGVLDEPEGDAGYERLADVVRRGLARRREDRYGDAAELLKDLRRLARGEAVGVAASRLAVVSFVNLAGAPDNEWIGTGIATSLAAELDAVDLGTGTPGDATSSDPQWALAEARRRGCGLLVRGSHQVAGARLRVVGHLCDAVTGETVEKTKVDGNLDDLFALQDELARWVGRCAGRGGTKVKRRGDAPLDAYSAFVRGDRILNRLAKGDLDEAAEWFRLAVERDGRYPDPHVGLACYHSMRFTYTTDGLDLRRSLSHADRAIELGARGGLPWVWRGYALFRSERHEEALASLARCMELEPQSHFGPYFSAAVKLAQNRATEALSHARRATLLQESGGFAWLVLGAAHYESDDFELALACFDRALESEREGRDGSVAGAAVYRGQALRRLAGATGGSALGAAREAVLEGLEMVESSDHMYRDTVRGLGLVVLGVIGREMDDAGAARAAFRQAIEHLRGRRRTLGGGLLLARAFSGLAAAAGDARLLDEARAAVAPHGELNRSWAPLCSLRDARRAIERAESLLGGA